MTQTEKEINEINEAHEKHIEELRKESQIEKRKGAMVYRGDLKWAGIITQEEFDLKKNKVIQDYRTGQFFLERIGRYRNLDEPLTLILLHLRREWIREYDIKTTPEFLLLDMALISYFHFIRLNEVINNIMANIEFDFFLLDTPKFRDNDKENKIIAEGAAHKMKELLHPSLDQFNRMFIKNLKALRDLRRGNILLNIGNVGQVNIGDKQINLEGGADLLKEPRHN